MPVRGGPRTAPALGEVGLAAAPRRRRAVRRPRPVRPSRCRACRRPSPSCPRATASRPSTATTQGMPSWRAMIAVWLVGPPSVVASATTSEASRPAVSTGARSSAHRIDGTSGTGTPGSGSPIEFGDDAVADVAQIGHALGHQPAQLGEHRDELVDGRRHRAAPRDCPRRSASRLPRSRRGPAPASPVVASTSDAAPDGVGGALAEPVRHCRGRRGEPRRLARALRLAEGGAEVRRRRRGARRGDHRRVLHTRHRGDAAGGRCAAAGVSSTWMTMWRSCEPGYKNPLTSQHTQG